MAGIGKQSKTTGLQARRELDNNEDDGRDKRPLQYPAAPP